MKFKLSIPTALFTSFSLMVLPLVSSAVSPVEFELHKRYVGTSDSMQLGSQVATVADITGDGMDDYLIKDVSSDGVTYSGRARIFASTVAGPIDANLDRPAVATVYGDLIGTLGSVVVMDVNADGQVDLIATHRDDMGGVFGAYVYYGPLAGTYTPADADVEFVSKPTSYPTVNVTSTPDVTGDGQPELVFYRQWNEGSPVGEVYVFTTPFIDTTIQINEAYTAHIIGGSNPYNGSYDGIGTYSPIAIDLDHNTQNDLVIPGYGASYTLPSPVSGDYQAVCIDDGELSCTNRLPGGERLAPGRVVSTQDVNGDSYDDFVIVKDDIIYGFTSAMIGDTTTEDADSVTTSDTDIQEILPLADQNEDGKMELIIWNETNAYLSNGLHSDHLTTIGRPLPDLFLHKPTDPYKYTTAVTGDYNGDGLTDVLVSAPVSSRLGKTRNGTVRQFMQL